MPGKLVRDKSTKHSRDLWAGVKEASAEYKKLPKWQRDYMTARYAELQESWKKPATCAHCGAETKGRCYPCYG